ncbi:MAG: N-acetylneuraminate synthase family protein [Endomicrobiales bacterium]|nr:N-acetylneuraminate synthase family protein [Endomicrobiales bacterium]
MKKSSDVFENLFIFEMANNHMGDVEHGLRIIRDVHAVCRKYSFQFAFKFQYRDLDTFIHPDYKDKHEYKYVKRFSETRISEDDFKKLKTEAEKLGFLTVCTPFDENSVDAIMRHKYDIIKIASCSFTDWPLLECIAKTDKPIIASTAGASVEDIDKVVSFFLHRDKKFALMHCVAEYPTKNENLQLNQIDLLKIRYPQVVLGYSTHEKPDNYEGIKIAVAKRASIFEKHVGVKTDKYGTNDYSATPEQLDKWLSAAKTAFTLCGVAGKRMKFTNDELASLKSLGRGVFSKRAIKKGEQIHLADTFLAIPTKEGQLIANDLSKYVEIYATENIEKGSHIMSANTKLMDNREKVYKIVLAVKDVIDKSGILVSSRLDLEISHHFGIDRFFEYGCTLINIINRGYCKKLIVVVPGQKHPEQHHKVKEETFHVLYGDIILELDGKKRDLKPGEIITIEKGVKHMFSSKNGAIIEEISSTHFTEDSYYTDPGIAKNKNRKTIITHWMNV